MYEQYSTHVPVYSQKSVWQLLCFSQHDYSEILLISAAGFLSTNPNLETEEKLQAFDRQNHKSLFLK